MRHLAATAAAMLLMATGGSAFAGEVGFQTASLPNPEGRPLDVGIWYPTDAGASPHHLASYSQDVAVNAPPAGDGHPLIVISHGSGGWFGGHYDTALALAKAGFVVAAVTHVGDSAKDQSRRVQIWFRPQQLKQLTDYMVSEWPGHPRIDTNRIGAFGFSAGGFTTLVAAGGTPDLSKIIPYCQGHPHTVTCGIVSEAPGLLQDLATRMPASIWTHDPRLKAAVVAAPALGFAFGKEGLSGVRMPMQLWRAEFDHVLPDPDYAEAVRIALPTPPEYHVVKNADHFDFLPPCPAPLAKAVPDICEERPGFDRAAFHTAFDRDVVAFFERTLR